MPVLWGAKMRKRELIEADGTRKDILTLEVLLDLRDLLAKQGKRGKVKQKKREDKE